MRPFLIALLFAGLASPAAAADKPKPCPSPVLKCSNGACRLEVAFPATPDTCTVRIDDAFISKQPDSTRITEKTTFRIQPARVNLLRYAVAFETKETVIDSYVFLEKLWKQVLGLGQFPTPETAAAAGVSPEQRFVNAINAWRAGLDKERAGVDGFVANSGSLTLTDPQVVAIGTEVGTLKGRRDDLNTLRDAAKAALARVEHFAIYDATLVTHQAVFDKLDGFEALGSLIVNGFDRKISFGAAGRVVAVTITATDRSSGQAQKQSIGVEFFVHSTLPVTFHAGYTIRGLKEQKFETVASSLASAGGADLFAKVQDADANSTFTAFMSYRLCDASRARRCAHLTIGTDFKDVGERLYGGVSWPFGRAFITVGAVSGETKEGTGVVSDVLNAAGRATDARELFSAINTKRKWGGFIGISFAPF
jgi:hypothetical protein